MTDVIWMTGMILLGAIIVALGILWQQRQKSARILERLSSLAREAARIPTYEEGLAGLSAELASAQRYQQPLTIGVLSLKSSGDDPETSAAIRTSSISAAGTPLELMFPIVGSLLQRSLRKSDRVLAGTDQNEYIIALTHSRKNQGAQAIWRIQQLLKSRPGIPASAGISEFPLDGYTIEDLLKTARAARAHSQVVETAPAAQHTAPEETHSLA